MICKTAIISEVHTLNSLNYADRGGELLAANYVSGSPKEIFQDFEFVQALNDRAKNKSIHSIISLNPKDDLSKLSTQDLIDISNQYLEKHGFINNQNATYIHREKEHLHLHIIANRITFEGKCVRSSHNYAKNVEFSKEMEEKYQLITTNRKTKGVDFIKDNARAEIIRLKIHQALLKSKTIDQFCTEMKNKQVLVLIGRGISFIDNSGVKFKGSDIGRKYSLLGIEKMLKDEPNIEYQNEAVIKIEKPEIETKITGNDFKLPFYNPKHFLKAGEDEEEDGRFKKRKKGLSR